MSSSSRFSVTGLMNHRDVRWQSAPGSADEGLPWWLALKGDALNECRPVNIREKHITDINHVLSLENLCCQGYNQNHLAVVRYRSAPAKGQLCWAHPLCFASYRILSSIVLGLLGCVTCLQIQNVADYSVGIRRWENSLTECWKAHFTWTRMFYSQNRFPLCPRAF